MIWFKRSAPRCFLINLACWDRLVFRFKDEEERTPVYLIINTTFPVLLEIFKYLLSIPNPSVEIADLIKLICKIFWSSAYVSAVLSMIFYAVKSFSCCHVHGRVVDADSAFLSNYRIEYLSI